MSDLQSLQVVVQEIKDKLDIVISALMGNPETPTVPGIIVRIDRLEQSNKFKSKVLWVFGTPFVIAIVIAVLRFYSA